jgi:NACalpha-BTF3-like transcription factor
VGDEEVPFLAEKDIPLKARGMNVPEELISNIMQQGFARDDVIQALIKFGGDSEAAVAHLLQKNAK